jgi:penicillin-binding protein 2
MQRSVRSNYRIIQQDHNKRVLFSILFFVALTLVLVLRLFQLQVISGQSMFNKSLDNQFTFATLQPQRGKILDRNGVIIAKNTPFFHLDLTISSKKSAIKSMQKVQQVFNLDHDTYDKLLEKINQSKKQATIRLMKNLTEQQRQLVYSENLHLLDVQVTPEFIRSYPCGSACATVTGYVLAQKLAKDEKSINPNILATYVGANGVEKTYNDSLSGQSGVVQLQRDAKGNILKSMSDIPANNGADITLTIDSRLQKIIEEKMENRKGAVIVSNPKNGEILALYSGPSYDPNVFLDPQQSDLLQDYLTSSERPLFNRALTGQFPPASTVKPFLALHALDTSLIDTNFRIYDTGSFRYKDTSNVYRNWNRSGHGYVDTRKAIIVSNDTFFYHLSLKIGIDQMSDLYGQYGFGQSTKIDLPAEKTGLLPSRQWKKSHGGTWLIGDTIITGIGQGSLLVTPIQMAFATNILATKGNTHYPHVVQSIHYPGMTASQPITPEKLATKLTFKHWNYIVSAMQKVIKFGTGRRFGSTDIPLAAKTGTAQLVRNSGKEHKVKSLSDHSWFIGFSNDHKYDFAITVLIENQNDAILVARDITNAYFNRYHHSD